MFEICPCFRHADQNYFRRKWSNWISWYLTSYQPKLFTRYMAGFNYIGHVRAPPLPLPTPPPHIRSWYDERLLTWNMPKDPSKFKGVPMQELFVISVCLTNQRKHSRSDLVLSFLELIHWWRLPFSNRFYRARLRTAISQKHMLDKDDGIPWLDSIWRSVW